MFLKCNIQNVTLNSCRIGCNRTKLVGSGTLVKANAYLDAKLDQETARRSPGTPSGLSRYSKWVLQVGCAVDRSKQGPRARILNAGSSR
jgi:hypothetical protein